MTQRSYSDLEARSRTRASHSLKAVADKGVYPANNAAKGDKGSRSHPADTVANPATSFPAAEDRLEVPETENEEQAKVAVTSNGEMKADELTSPDANSLMPDSGGTGNGEIVAEGGFAPVLKNRNFLALWGGQVFSQLADKVYLVLAIALIANHFGSEDQTISGWVSAVMISFTIPAVVFGSLAGVFVDRWPKKWVMVATNLLRGGLVLAMPFLLWISQGWAPLGTLPLGFCILLGITFLVSTLTQFFAPAEQATIPLIVEPRHLLSANSLYTMTMMASVIVGFAVGEPVLGIADAIAANFGLGVDIGKELVVGGSYAIAGLVLLLIKTGENTSIEHESPHVWQDVRDGVSYLRSNKNVRNALIQLIILFSIFAALSVLAVRLATVLPGIRASQFGFLLAAGGLGMAFGATIVGHAGRKFSHTQLSLYGSMGMAASLVGLGIFTHSLWLSLLLTTCLGTFAALVAVPMQTTIQAETPDQMRGKVFGLQNNVINIALSLPLALAGVAETILGLQTVFLGLAAIAIAGGVLTWYISRTGNEK
ncbi:MFS transporter [Microcoleus sp. FACHB-831]|nr:MFS transporter [Microcoleus sp. FACHB-831]